MISEAARPHTPPRSFPGVDRSAILEAAPSLAERVPTGTTAKLHLDRLVALLTTSGSTKTLLRENEALFDEQNARLRRTRNALLHGGPIVSTAVERGSEFAVTVANFALYEVLTLMLDGEDLVTGTAKRARERRQRADRLAAGSDWADALWGPLDG